MNIFCRRILLLIVLFSSASASASRLDADGNGRGDLALNRDGTFMITAAPGERIIRTCGNPGDIPVPGRYQPGEGSTVAVWNPSSGEWRFCGASERRVVWGLPGDTPVPGDYDGNGLDDFAVYRPGEWVVLTNAASGATVTTTLLGAPGDIPVPADYDGDGRTDPAVFHRDVSTGGTSWLGRLSSGGEFHILFGLAGDIPVVEDYDGDGRADLAVWRSGEGRWYLRIGGQVEVRQFGLDGDLPAPTDFGGDRRADFVVYRPREGRWHVSIQGAGTMEVSGGGPGDRIASSGTAHLIDGRALGDVDGDRAGDLALLRADGNGELRLLLHSTSGSSHPTPSLVFGRKGDLVSFADFDGNGLSDLAAIAIEPDRRARWHLSLVPNGGSPISKLVFDWGKEGDTFLVGDFDGDRRSDLAAVQTRGDGVLEWQLRTTGVYPVPPVVWGVAGDQPITGDVDGDRKSDYLAVRSSGGELQWFTRTAKGSTLPPRVFGATGDRPLVGDFDSNGVADLALLRRASGRWSFQVEGSSPVDVAPDVDTVLIQHSPGGLGPVRWRLDRNQGVFVVRDTAGNELSAPFGVAGDRPLDALGFTRTGDLVGVATRLNCARRAKVTSQARGFVWVAEADSTGKLAILLPRSFTGKVKRAALVESTPSGDRVIETLKFRGLTNGGRLTFDGRLRGNQYPKNVILIRQNLDDSYACITVSNPGKNYIK